jgi:hypothetical protein
MKYYFLLAGLLLTLSQIALGESTLPDIREGLWELTFKSDIGATPTSMPSVAYTSQHCLNRKSAGDPQTLLQNNNCEISDLNQQTNLITWNMRCQQQGIQMTGNGKANYSHESFSGAFNMTMQGEQKDDVSLKITTQTTGRYLGDCK